jgi:1-acyl-sn-glycerol-3-phosphate acyltransferase
MTSLAASRYRRLLTVPGVALMAVALTASAPLWIPLSLAYDLVRARVRFPTARLVSFGLWWAWLETIGVVMAAGLWVIGRASDREAHYRLQGWWAGRLVAGLRVLCRLEIDVEGVEALADGPLIVCGRHASLADSLLPAWLLAVNGPMRPRYVMKRELLLDPCLDIVGNRVPNCFVDRGGHDTGRELEGIERLARDMGPRDAAVIFPEGGVGSASRRRHAMSSLVDRDPARYSRLALLSHLMPPRSKGTIALLRGAPDADVVLMAHVGLEGLGRVAGASRHIPLDTPVRVRLQRIPRADVPPESELADWLDARWLEMDAWIETAEHAPRRGPTRASGATLETAAR